MLPRDQGKDETWQDWWDRHAADRIDGGAVTNIIPSKSEAKRQEVGRRTDEDTSPDAQEIAVVGSIFNGE